MNWLRAFQFVAIALTLFAADALLKVYVHLSIPVMNIASPIYPYDGIGVFQNWHGIDFAIAHVINKGAAWGVFAGLQEYLLYVRIAIIIGILVYLFAVKAVPFYKFCLTLIVTGAVGNVADYFVYGHVVDMFYFILWGYSFPVFNIADSAIFCGISLLLLRSLFLKMRKTSDDPTPQNELP
jgi:signal peptidase II